MIRGLRYTIEDLKAYAASRGGECLSKKYETLLTKYRWRCKEGHVWVSTAKSTFKGGSWCAECSKKARSSLTAAVYREAIAERGGRVLPEQEKGFMHFVCMHGHEFKHRPIDVVHGKWCPVCKDNAKAAYSAWECAKTADRHGGIILTPWEQIRNMVSVVECRCAQGHVFHVTAYHLCRKNVWCKQCFFRGRRKVAQKAR